MCNVMLLVLLLVTCWGAGEVSSGGQSQHLLRHPHYSQGHRHGIPTTQHSNLESRSRWPEPVPVGSYKVEERGRWTRVAPAPKEYYKTHHSQKTTSAAKTHKIVDPIVAKELWEVREANEHFVRMRQEGKCGSPMPRVLRVRDFYPDQDLLPRCTILHRCAEDTGCCEDPASSCAPKTVQQVVVHFYMIGANSTSTVEKLLFTNHTECECRPRAQADHAIPSVTCASCPLPFSRRELEDGRCSCDCFDKHKPCIRVKRGREALADAERRCVESGRCHVPDCDYGPFEPEKGRCPRRPDSEGPKNKNPNHRNPNHRWTYFERD